MSTSVRGRGPPWVRPSSYWGAEGREEVKDSTLSGSSTRKGYDLPEGRTSPLAPAPFLRPRTAGAKTGPIGVEEPTFALNRPRRRTPLSTNVSFP